MNLKTNYEKRAWELDFARGTAVMLMAAFHAVFDLNVYFNQNIDYSSGFWFWVGRLSAISFMYVSGISAGFSKSLFKRGIFVLACGMVITAASVPVMGENYIRFGILHFFGVAMILNWLLRKAVKSDNAKNVIFAVLIFASYPIGNAFSQIAAKTPLLLPLGIMPAGFSSYDYYPLFPWLAYYSAGTLTGSLLYKNRQSIFNYTPYSNAPKNAFDAVVVGVCFLGRNSLVVYMAHQPVIFAVFYILFSIPRIFS